jgi:hypothetical protein
MSRNEQRLIDDILRGYPLVERLALLCSSLMVEDATMTAENLVDVAVIVAEMSGERAGIAFLLREAAARLDVQWQ